MEAELKLRKKIVAACLVMGAVLGMAGQATAHHNGGRADGVCGGIGHYNPVTGECEE